MAIIYRLQVSTDATTWTDDARRPDVETGINWSRWLSWGHGPGRYYLRLSTSIDNEATWSEWSEAIGPVVVSPRRIARTVLAR